MARVPGTPMDLNGRAYVLAPVALGPARRFMEASRAATSTEELMQAAVHVVFASLQRNHPEVTLDMVENELLDVRNWQDVLAVVTGVSQLVDAPGKSQAPTESGLSGMTCTHS